MSKRMYTYRHMYVSPWRVSKYAGVDSPALAVVCSVSFN